MGRYVGGKWREDLPSAGPEDQVQGNSVPVSSPSQSSAPVSTTPATTTTSGGGGGVQIYNTANGPRTPEQMMRELEAAGWDHSGEIKDVYARTTGGPVSATGQTTTTNPVGQQALNNGTININPNDMDQLRKFFGQTAGFSREELAEKSRQFNENLALVEKQWEREGKSRLQIDIDAQALRKYQAEQDIALSRSKLGLDYLTTASQLGGPADYYQQSDFLRGAQANSDVPMLLRSLAENTAMPAFTGAGAVNPAPQTMEGLTARLTGATTPNAYNPDQTLAMIGNVFKRGATGLQPGTLERLDPNELALLKSGARKLGYDSDAWLRQYSAAGIGQASGSSF